MKRNGAFVFVVAVVILAGAAYSALHFVNERSAQSCKACARPVHSHMKTVAMVGGKRTVYCCPACALSEHVQSGTAAQVVELSDYLTGAPLNPQSSFLVRNSDVNPCLPHRPVIGEGGHPAEEHFDRCNPSVLAFRDRESAIAFANGHGGQVLKFSDFASEFK